VKLILFLLRYSPGQVALAAFIGVISGLSSVALMAVVFSKLRSGKPVTPTLGWVFAGLVIVVLASNLISHLLLNYLSQRATYDLRINLCRQILDVQLRHLEETGFNRILASLTQDITMLTSALLGLPTLFTNLTIVLGCLLFLGWLSPTMLVSLLIFLAIWIPSYVIPHRKAREFLRKARGKWDSLVNLYRALIEGIKELKLHRHRREAFLSDVLQSTAAALRHNNFVGTSIYAGINSWSRTLHYVFIGLILFVLPSLQSTHTQVLMGATLVVIYVTGPIGSLVNLLQSFAQANIAYERIQQLGVSLTTFAAGENVTAHADVFQGWEHLELVGVTYTYYEERENHNFTLGPLDLTFYPGELVFLVGGNGSGKTTLAKLLTGLYIPESGEIQMNGEPITDDNRDHYRQVFSAIFADSYLFEVFLGLDAPEIDARARDYLVQLQLDHKVQVKNGTLSTTNLSHGQRKRLALLTAYLEDRPIYLFDEWAAGQDPTFKEVFYLQILPELKAKGKTVFVISHDDHYYHVADRIIKLDYGKIEYDKRMIDVPAEIPVPYR
jgi:putative ATP-binding cassette transporter